MRIPEWPPEERPREKLLARGPAALSDAELLAIFLGSGTPGKTAVDLARELLDTHGGLRGLLDTERTALCRSRGLGPARFTLLKAALELGRRYLETRLQRAGALSSPGATRDYLSARLRGYGHEVFACLFLDNRHRMISFDEMFAGTIDSATVHPREVVASAPCSTMPRR